MAKTKRPQRRPLKIAAWLKKNSDEADAKQKQRELAKAIGYSESHVSLLISGGRPYTQETHERIAAFFGVPPAWLFYEPGELPLELLYAEISEEDQARARGFLEALLPDDHAD